MVEQPYARRVQRHSVELPCSIIGPNWDEPITFAVADLSARGMWVRTTFPFRRGEHVVVEFQPPRALRGPRVWRSPVLMPFARVARSQRPVVEGGRVVRRGGMGLEFCDLSRDERRALQRCLRATPTLRDHRDEDRPRDSGGGWRAIRGRW